MGALIPIGLGLGALGSYLGNRSQAKQQEAQAKLYNDWVKNYQNTGQNLYSQAQAGGWNPFGPHVNTTTQGGSTTMQGNTSFNNRPVITQQYAPLDEMMRSIMSGRLSSGTGLPAGYESNAVRGINESFEGADQAARNLAARRGLSGEQTYAIASPANRARAGALSSMRSSLPLLARELQNQDIGITSGLQSAFGRGEAGSSTSSQMGTSNSMGQSTSPFSAGDLNELMHALVPPGPQQTTQTGYSPVGSGISSLGALMGYLAANQGQQPWMSSQGGFGPAGPPPGSYGYG